jgi:replicative DNA helicase
MADLSVDRIPPQNLEAEQATLGSALLQGSAVVAVQGIVSALDFYRQAHGEIWMAITAVADRNEPVDLITLQDELRRRGWLEQVGGVDYLMTLVDSVPTAANAAFYAERVKEAATRRRLLALASQIAAQAIDEERVITRIITDTVAQILALTTTQGGRLRHVGLVLDQLWDRIDAAFKDGTGFIGLRTGLSGLDNLIGGLEAGDLMIVGARPSKGKSALALQIALNVANHVPVLFCSLEMSAAYLTLRHLGGVTGIETSRLRRGTITEDDWTKLSAAIGRESQRNLWYFEAGAVPIGELQTEVRRAAITMAVEDKTPRLLIVDHLGFVEGGTDRDNRVVQIGKAVLGIKTLARELNIPAIACCQLHRPERETAEGKQEKKPTLESLRESGHIEEHSDLVLLIYNPESGVGKLLTDPVRASLILAKHRNGPTGTVPVMWNARIQRFLEIEERQEEAT